MAASQSIHDHTRMHNWRILWWAAWCIAGVGSVVVAFGMGVFLEVNDRLRELLSDQPFYLPGDAFALSPLSVFLFMIAGTLFFIQSLMYTYGFFRRLFLLIGTLIVVILTIPVCAMWGIYLSTASLVLSLVVAGVGAVVTPLFLKSLKPVQKKQGNR